MEASAAQRAAERDVEAWPLRAGAAPILGVPGLAGTCTAAAALAAHAFPGHAVWTARAELRGRRLMDDGLWLDVAETIAGMILRGAVPRPALLAGFSMEGWMAWLVAGLVAARGGPALPVLNLDGLPLHPRYPAWAERLAAVLPPGLPAVRMLLVHRVQPRRVELARDPAAAWREAGIAPATLPVLSARHGEMLLPLVLRHPALAGLAEPGAGWPESLPPFAPDTPGGRLFTLLDAPAPPSPAAVAALIAGLPKRGLDKSLPDALLFAALSCGDPAMACDMARRIAAQAPGSRPAAYAEVAALAQSGALAEARARAEAWIAAATPLLLCDTAAAEALRARAAGPRPAPPRQGRPKAWTEAGLDAAAASIAPAPAAGSVP